ncbi:NADH-dependent butanol dehydrogenase A [compost metagenome]
MWTGTIAHNGLLGTGRIEDWGSHMIAHEIGALYDLTHGATLSIVLPAWMKYVYKENIDRFVQFAVRVWNVEQDFYNPENVIIEGISKMTEFFNKSGLPTTLGEANISGDRIEEMAEKCTKMGPVGNLKKLYKDDVIKILKLAL